MVNNVTQTSKTGPLRSLLPRQAVTSPVIASTPSLRPRRVQTVAACNTCRSQKAKCSGDRPTCRRCARRQLPCVYTTHLGETPLQALNRRSQQLSNRATVYEELFTLIRSLPHRDAQVVMQRIRAGDDPENIVNLFRTGDILLQMAVRPETRFRYEFPYETRLPPHLVQNNQYLTSTVFESLALYPNELDSSSVQGMLPHDPDMPIPVERASSCPKPFHAADLIEPHLSDAQISWWTSVCKDDKLMRDLLKHFFLCEYQFSAAFQKDLFMEDLATHREDFCSRLLVNCVLAYSCVCYPHFADRARYWDPHSLMYRFLAEAKRLWELEASEPRVTTMQAGIILTVIHNLCGLDEIGKNYRTHAIALAQASRLFEAPLQEGDGRLQHGTAFTAWTLYNWETLTAFSFMTAPLVTRPPNWHLPALSASSQWCGEFWHKYPSDQQPFSSDFSEIFLARCRFRVIMNEFCNAAYSHKETVSLELAQQLHERLMKWYEELPRSLRAENVVLPGHLQLHMYYHHLILTIYQPLICGGLFARHQYQYITAEAERCLHTLVRLYYLRHGYEAMDLFIVIPLTMIAYECIDAIDEQLPDDDLQTLRSTLILVAQGLYTQRHNHYLAQALFHVIRGRMRPEEAALLRSTVISTQEVPDPEQEMTQVVRSHWPISLVKRISDVESHMLEHLVKDYAHLNAKEGSPVDFAAK